jgi:hypothetical protein
MFAATVLVRTFQGETEQVRVRIGSQEMVLLDRPTALPPVAPGEPARVHIPPDAVRVFARETAPAAFSRDPQGSAASH